MSHWSGDRLSESLAGEFGKPPGSGPFVARLSSGSLTPNPCVDAAASIRESLSTAAPKLGDTVEVVGGSIYFGAVAPAKSNIQPEILVFSPSHSPHRRREGT
jgi:hypothetical protein